MSSNTPFLLPLLANDNGTLALRPLQIAGMVRPLDDADGGINIAVVTENPDGILSLIAAYLDMKEGDKHVIYWDGSPVETREVQPGEVDKNLFFYLPKALFTPGGVECYYQLTRFGETTPDDPSVPLLLWTKLTRPGGRDKEPHLPDGHSELRIVQLPPELITQGVVDAEWAENGFDVTIKFYLEITVGDAILMHWGSTILPPHVVTQEQADGLKPIVIHVDQAAILAAGDSDKLEVKYYIYDRVWNWAERHSKRTYIAVDAGGWRLAAPIIKDSINGIITIKDLNKQDVTVQVHIQGTNFALGDTVTITWIGNPLTGKPLIHTESRAVTSIPSIMEFKVPYEDVRAIAMGRADVSYVLTKIDGSPPLSSKRTFADVVGDVSLLPEPKIRELTGDILESDSAYATVDVRYAGIANGDLVRLIWLGKTSSDQPYLHEEEHTVSQSEAEEGFITFYIGNVHIIVLDNGHLDLSYRVSNDQVALYGVSESERLLAKVEKVRATLPAPKVVEADDDVLDPSKVFDAVHVLIEILGTLKDDILTYYWQGPFASTSDWLPFTSVIEGKPVRFRVAKEFVTDNIGQYVKVRYSLKHAATGLYSYSATLNLLVGSLVGDLPQPKVLQAPNDLLDPIQGLNGVDVEVSYKNMDPSLDTIGLRWIGTPGAGTSTDLELPGDSSGSVLFHLPKTVVGPNINKTVDVNYVVRRYGHETDSESLGLRVLGFQDPETELPRPQVPQAPAGILDLMAFTGDARILLQPWPYIAPKQYIWLRLEGETSAGSSYIINLLDGVEITAAQESNGLNETLRRSELMKLGHSTPVTGVCKVTFDGDPEEKNATEFPRLSLTIRTRYDYVTPAITDVIDSKGQVPEGDITFDKQVTVKGTATRDEQVALFDGSEPLGTADVEASGVWAKLLINLNTKDYHITAHALYEANPVSSPLRAFTVAQTVMPSIDNVTDSKGPVAEGGITFDKTVTVKGKASPNQKIRLRDGTTSLGEPTADNIGEWTLVVNALSVKTYSLTALALYGDGAVSTPPRTFTVKTWVDSITDFNNGTSGNWVKGPAASQGVITGGRFHNETTAATGHAGVLFRQAFELVVGKTYSFSYQARNFAVNPKSLPPIFSVRFASGQSILPTFNVPQTNQWYTQTNTFSVAQTGNYELQIISHQNRGGGSDSDGGNDYDIDNIIVRLVN